MAALDPGTRLGHYEVQALLGAGGMGEVYEAKDTRLGRRVAIKVLPEEFRRDPERLKRLEREARLLANLNHPGIATLHGLEDLDDMRFLVMELVEGETLADRLARGSVSLENACAWGAQIAEALAAAHERGINHRDLKPSNVMMAGSAIKLLDFGLAKATPIAVGAVAEAETLPAEARLTEEQSIVGTLAYMAPEVLEGKEADARSDIWALGVMLYEMATGQPPFEGGSRASLIAAILERQPAPVADRCTLAPPQFDHLVASCLAKGPDQRRGSAGDLALDLRWVGERLGAPEASQVGDPLAVREGRLRPWLFPAATALALLAAVLAWTLRPIGETGIEAGAPVAFTLPVSDLPGNATETGMAVSPDGDALVYSESADGEKPVLWLREFDDPEPQPIPGTEGALNPFWSPDGNHIGYVQNNVVRYVDRQGGVARTLTTMGAGEFTFGPPSWSPDGTVLLSRYTGGEARGFPKVVRLRVSGGEPVPVSVRVGEEASNWDTYPAVLDDGKRFLCLTLQLKPNRRQLYLASLNGGEALPVEGVNSRAEYAAGHLFYLDQGKLIARGFDPETARFIGDPVVLGDMTGAFLMNTGMAHFSVARNGAVVAYGTSNWSHELRWFDEDGRDLGSLGKPAPLGWFRISPSGDRVAITVRDPVTGSSDIQILDAIRGVPTPFLRGPTDFTTPTWSPDGQRIAFSSDAEGAPSIYIQRADGSGGPTRIHTEQDHLPQYVMDWSSDGKLIAYVTFAADTDLYLIPSDGEGPSRLVAGGPGHQFGARFSPNNRWIAFNSEEEGRMDIFIAPIAEDGMPMRVTTGGGGPVTWLPDGTELLFARESSLFAVSFDPVTGTIGSVRESFSLSGAMESGMRFNIETTPDGRRLLIPVNEPGLPGSRITVLVNPLADQGR